MSSPKHSIVFSKVIPALQADRNGVIAIQYGLDDSAARSRVVPHLAGNARECAGTTNSVARDPAITRRRSGVAKGKGSLGPLILKLRPQH